MPFSILWEKSILAFEAKVLRTQIQAFPGFTLTSGTITGNKAEYGAGVYAEKIASTTDQIHNKPPTTVCAFALNGGSVTGNEADFVGGGFYLLSEAALVRGKGIVSGNTAGEDIFVKK
ncbi:MAG: hypothetical protein LBB83_00365 [Treponema sp.]|nr:hypothetical protein [Treponema sp.]